MKELKNVYQNLDEIVLSNPSQTQKIKKSEIFKIKMKLKKNFK